MACETSSCSYRNSKKSPLKGGFPVLEAGLESIQLIYLSFTTYITHKLNKYNALQNIYSNRLI